MPRELFPERNVVEVYDSFSGTEMEFYCLTPTDAQRLQWNNAAERKGKKIVITERTLKKQTRLSAEIITGFRKGDHTVHGAAISSDEADPAFFKDWKPALVQAMPDVLRTVGQKMFAGARDKKGEEQDVDVVIEDLSDPDLDFTLEGDDPADPTPAAATGVPEAAPAENP